MTSHIPNPAEFRRMLNTLDGRHESSLGENEIVSFAPIAIVGALSNYAKNGADMPFEPEQAKGHKPKYPTAEINQQFRDTNLVVPELLKSFSEEDLNLLVSKAQERGATTEQFFQITTELGLTGLQEFFELG